MLNTKTISFLVNDSHEQCFKNILNKTFSKQARDTTPDIIDEVTNDVDGLVQELERIETRSDELSHPASPSEHVKFAQEEETSEHTPANDSGYYQHENEYYTESPHHEYYSNQRSLSPFHYNKRQTGKKNISSIIVGSDNKIEFSQTDDRGFGSVKINRPIGYSNCRTFDNLNDSDSVNSRDTHSHTADGFFDLKFYSHPLW